MEDIDFKLAFRSDDRRNAGLAAREFSGYLREIGVQNSLIPDEAEQDFGVIVGIILGSAAIVEIARGAADYIRKYKLSDVEIIDGDRTIRVSNVQGASVESLVKKIIDSLER